MKGFDNIENLFERPTYKFENEIVNTLLSGKNIRIEKIISDGHTTGWYDQDHDEFVCLLTGYAELEIFNDNGALNTIKLSQGDNILLKKHTKHRVTKTTKCNWLCIFFNHIEGES